MADGYTRVTPTPTETANYRRKHGRPAAVYRVECDACGRRLWGSGLGIGSHNRACPGPRRCACGHGNYEHAIHPSSCTKCDCPTFTDNGPTKDEAP